MVFFFFFFLLFKQEDRGCLFFIYISLPDMEDSSPQGGDYESMILLPVFFLIIFSFFLSRKIEVDYFLYIFLF